MFKPWTLPDEAIEAVAQYFDVPEVEDEEDEEFHLFDIDKDPVNIRVDGEDEYYELVDSAYLGALQGYGYTIIGDDNRPGEFVAARPVDVEETMREMRAEGCAPYVLEIRYM